jgi:DNA-binding NtrC family response regulator
MSSDLLERYHKSNSQIAFLRIIETREYQQIGPESEVKRTNVRVLFATHRDLEELLSLGVFREDLVCRLKRTIINVPSLGDRREDIPLLVERFIDKCATMTCGVPSSSCRF